MQKLHPGLSAENAGRQGVHPAARRMQFLHFGPKAKSASWPECSGFLLAGRKNLHSARQQAEFARQVSAVFARQISAEFARDSY